MVDTEKNPSTTQVCMPKVYNSLTKQKKNPKPYQFSEKSPEFQTYSFPAQCKFQYRYARGEKMFQTVPFLSVLDENKIHYNSLALPPPLV